MEMYIQTYDSPLGELYLCSDGEWLTGLWFASSNHYPQQILDYDRGELTVFRQTRRWLDSYFSGKEPTFQPAYHIEGLTPFRSQVITCLQQIPYGKVTTYQTIAAHIAKQNGMKKMSAQAVGGAVGWNPISIIIPCHRVIGKNGSLTGYGGGLQNKIRLLELEGIDCSAFYIPEKGSAR